MESLPSLNPALSPQQQQSAPPPLLSISHLLHTTTTTHLSPILTALVLLVFLSLLALLAFLATTSSSNRIALAVRLLRLGPVPRHVAFIMDGNRRFARREGVKTRTGHEMGFEALEKILEACMKLGVRAVTVYAFSIENFKRSAEEVETLMGLFKEKLYKLAENEEVVHKHGIAVRLIGAIEMLPKDVREAADRLVEATRGNTRAILNVACPYTSRHEITTAVSRAVEKAAAAAAEEPLGGPREISAEEIEAQLFTASCPPLDVLIRTSGEMRLSDFMLWQACEKTCLIFFVPVYWPQFSFWDMVPILLSYQVQYSRRQGAARRPSCVVK